MSDNDNNQILNLSDTHFPYHHPDTFDFVFACKHRYEPDRIIHCGDVTDQYCFSRFPKDPEFDEGYTSEFNQLRENVKTLHGIFPKMDIVSSNHDDRAWDRAKSGGIPRSAMLPFMTMIGADSYDWELHDDLLINVKATGDDWYFSHYRGANTLAAASKLGVHTCTGHTHTKGAVNSAITINGRLYGVDVPCLVGDDRHAFAYNRMAVIRPNLGLILISRGVPRLIPMDIIRLADGSSKWDGKVA